jgi:hypothetical protein
MLNDLSRSIDFALSNAKRGTNAAGASDGTSAMRLFSRLPALLCGLASLFVASPALAL